jgi:hypothetical protein
MTDLEDVDARLTRILDLLDTVVLLPVSTDSSATVRLVRDLGVIETRGLPDGRETKLP